MDRYWKNVEKARKAARDNKRRQYPAKRRDPAFRALKAIRNATSRIKRRVRRTYKSCDLLGVKVDVARAHIEKQFKRGMTWENHGTAWEIDHIIPIASFNLKIPAEARAASHYKNLRPLWKHLNRAKSARFDGARQMQLI